MCIKKKHRHLVTETGFSFRGSYIIGQALAVAISVMETAENPELSNIEGMKLLRDFFLFYPVPLKAGLVDMEHLKAGVR